MKRTFLAAIMAVVILALTGCGDGSSPPPAIVAPPISSTLAFDGDIKQDFLTGTLTLRISPPTVRAGLDPLTNDEYRGFLNFSLASIPPNAVIASATLDIVINSILIQPAVDTIPMRIELVSFTPPLQATDFDRAVLLPLEFVTFPIFRTDVFRPDLGNSVLVDVTTLMERAQFRGEPNFQIRILENLGVVSPGLIEIDDTTVNLEPLLTVTYF